eukprot:CAMPEP_0170545426 /NCGR_PEP_ID=MMETSP0211-20121228/3819_1 /TAXON_ID=311385 /ORGANISM="Pseudokeronopsis sp., Strain OXSARD2" /LENGTH=53 /DNA_ID=CAMNT_0010849323 /DNA_START=249 /DNA_END=410 /DNA_ORIENTATION=+
MESSKPMSSPPKTSKKKKRNNKDNSWSSYFKCGSRKQNMYREDGTFITDSMLD